jgi:hypothetical protein
VRSALAPAVQVANLIDLKPLFPRTPSEFYAALTALETPPPAPRGGGERMVRLGAQAA